MSNLAASLYKKSPEQIFTAWAWEMVSRLRLHATDQVLWNLSSFECWPVSFLRVLRYLSLKSKASLAKELLLADRPQKDHISDLGLNNLMTTISERHRVQGFLDWSSQLGNPGLGQGLSRAGELNLLVDHLLTFYVVTFSSVDSSLYWTYTMMFNTSGSIGSFFLISLLMVNKKSSNHRQRRNSFKKLV